MTATEVPIPSSPLVAPHQSGDRYAAIAAGLSRGFGFSWPKRLRHGCGAEAEKTIAVSVARYRPGGAR